VSILGGDNCFPRRSRDGTRHAAVRRQELSRLWGLDVGCWLSPIFGDIHTEGAEVMSDLPS
jgi:hypothetical protein